MAAMTSLHAEKCCHLVNEHEEFASMTFLFYGFFSYWK